MPDLQNLLDQIDRLESELATAPWFVANANEETEYMPFWQVMNHAYLNDPGTEDDVYCDVEMCVGSKADAEFIALARTALPALSRAVRAALELHKTRVHDEDPTSPFCNFCGPGTPCETTRAITDALGDDDD